MAEGSIAAAGGIAARHQETGFLNMVFNFDLCEIDACRGGIPGDFRMSVGEWGVADLGSAAHVLDVTTGQASLGGSGVTRVRAYLLATAPAHRPVAGRCPLIEGEGARGETPMPPVREGAQVEG